MIPEYVVGIDPPGISFFSNTPTFKPFSAKRVAATRPALPAPTTTTS